MPCSESYIVKVINKEKKMGLLCVQMEAVRSMTNKKGLPLIHKHFCWRYIFSMLGFDFLVYCNNQLWKPAWRERPERPSTLSVNN